MPTLIIQNGALSPPGLALEVLRSHGHAIRVVEVFQGEALPPDLDDVDSIICCGGEQSARKDVEDPLIQAECDLLAQAHAAGIPILGLCLGAQILARALGGTVERIKDGPEVGFVELALTPAGREDALYKGIPWWSHQYCWHEDEITELPPDAKLLVTGKDVTNQAFVVGTTSYGLQYHPEYGEEPLREHSARTDSFAEVGGGTESLIRDLELHGPAFMRHGLRFFESVALFLMPVDRLNAGIRRDLAH
ncbi:MAG: hypothetical protein CBC35_01860 [Planctomycetes bacterium TMED75]|nr:glutamine amidotransferase [Planctomycetaceae bacterium]OUU96062.1 MAG: hypothetical protein CBC35_01860 [Planctomycetes bacterium TMED75]